MCIQVIAHFSSQLNRVDSYSDKRVPGRQKKSYVLRLWAVLYLPVLISMVAQIEGRGNSVASHCRR